MTTSPTTGPTGPTGAAGHASAVTIAGSGGAAAGRDHRRLRCRRLAAVAVSVGLLTLGACRGGGATPDGSTEAATPLTDGSAPSGTVAVGAAATEATVAFGIGAASSTPSSDPGDGQTPPSLPAAAKVGLAPQGKEPRNDLGELVRLDETASLACAHAEFASEAFDDADPGTARQEITAIVRWGAPSANADISRASSALGAAAGTVAVSRDGVDAFLALCQSNGHR